MAYRSMMDEVDDSTAEQDDAAWAASGKPNPYGDISSRVPTPTFIGPEANDDQVDDGADEEAAMAVPPPAAPGGPDPRVRAAIQARSAPPPGAPPSAVPPIAADPAMAQYERDQAGLADFRTAKRGADQVSNFGRAFQQIAQGSNAPKDNGISAAMDTQNAGQLKSQEEDVDRRQKIVNAIEGRRSHEAIAKSNYSLRDAIQKQNMDVKNKRLETVNIGSANRLMSNPNIGKETTKLNAARSVQSLVDSIRSGELKDSKNIRNQLTNMIATIELGTPGGVSDRHEMGIDTLYTKLKDAESLLLSSPQSTIPGDYLKQLETEGNALGDRAAKNFKGLTDSILSGADLSGGEPDADPGQIHQLVRQRAGKFLSTNGYDPNTGERVGGSRHVTQQAESTYPKQVRKGGKVATVSSPQELQEASADGWQ